MKNLNLHLIQKVFLISCLALIIKSGASGQSADTNKAFLISDQSMLTALIEQADATRTAPIENIDVILEKNPIPAWIVSGPKFMNEDPYFNGVAAASGKISGSQQVILSDKSGEKWTSYFTLSDNNERDITNGGMALNIWYTAPPAPSNAIITNVHYHVLIDDDGEATHFYPSDYGIEIYSLTTTVNLWNEAGSFSSHTDMGLDDDDEDDSDIYLEGNFDDFNGEDAVQTFSFLVQDYEPGSGHGKFCNLTLMISWQAPDPNLITDYTPPAWSAPIVANHSSGSYSNAPVLYANTTTYMNYNFGVEGTAIPAGYGIDGWITIDGDAAGAFGTSDGVEVGGYYSYENIEEVFTEGSHEICQIVDLLDSYPESDEGDNEYCVTYTWVGPPDAPDLAAPANEARDQSGTLTLSWYSSDNATGYTLQVDNNSNFSSTLVNVSVSETLDEVTGLSEGETYYWRVSAENPAGTGDWSEVREFTTEGAPDALTDAENTGYYLGQNYPNPFTGKTTIEFNLPAGNQVSIEIMDLQGKLIESFSGYYAAGKHMLEIDMNGKVQSGVYFYRMTTDDFIDTKFFTLR